MNQILNTKDKEPVDTQSPLFKPHKTIEISSGEVLTKFKLTPIGKKLRIKSELTDNDVWNE